MRDRSPTNLWEIALGQLELQVTRPNFDTWLRSTTGLRFDGSQLVVGVPSDFALEWLRSRMSPLIGRTVSSLAGADLSVSFEVLGVQPLAELPANRALPAQPAADLNPRLTFDSFTVVKSNRLAYRAARKLASGGGDMNPLVLFGSPGLGKTHLLHGIGHEVARVNKRAVLLTGEAFVNRFVKALRAGEPATFRSLFDECNVFLLDDLQFLASRRASQEQFLHIFNSLLTAGAVIAVAVDQDPAGLTGLSPSLRSRLTAGLSTELPLPPANERLDILRAKAARLSRPLPPDILQFISEQPAENIRELEGAMNRVAAYADLTHKPLTHEAARQALRPSQPVGDNPQPSRILQAVCRYFRVTPQQLASASRSRDVTYARHVAMYLLRERTDASLADIGRQLGQRDHSTVLSGYRRIQKEIAALPQTRSVLDEINALLSDSAA